MNDYLIVCYSVTCAQRTSRVLQRAGVGNRILRVSAGMVKSGCGYAVQIREADLHHAIQVMERANIRREALLKHTDNGYSEVSYDLF